MSGAEILIVVLLAIVFLAMSIFKPFKDNTY